MALEVDTQSLRELIHNTSPSPLWTAVRAVQIAMWRRLAAAVPSLSWCALRAAFYGQRSRLGTMWAVSSASLECCRRRR